MLKKSSFYWKCFNCLIPFGILWLESECGGNVEIKLKLHADIGFCCGNTHMYILILFAHLTWIQYEVIKLSYI
jgi:hypothetical protein